MKRPNGGGVMIAGWLLIAGGAISIMVGVPGRMLGAIVFGGGLANLGVLLVAVGYIVRALFFLPGRTVEASEIDPAAPVPAPTAPHAPPSRSPIEEQEMARAADKQLLIIIGTITAISVGGTFLYVVLSN